MSKEARTALISIPIVLIIAVGVALAGSQRGVVVFGFPLFALCLALAFLIQWIAFIPAFINQTESFYDLTGSVTYITVIVVSVLLSPSIGARSLLCSCS
jgi:hypothetical protein